VSIQAVKGTHDVLPEVVSVWHRIETAGRELFALYGYREIRTPVFEETELFARGIGAETDIVSKEMYTFTDRSERSMTLRPEGTAGVVRAILERGVLKQAVEAKLFYLGPMFRYERPQKGRQRQFHQIGCEWFGSPSPWADAETIAMLTRFLEACGFRGVRTRINSLGSRKDRPAFNALLREYLRKHFDSLCEDCRRRAETNPLRALDCKNPGCQPILSKAPAIGEHLGQESREHFDAVCAHLKSLDVEFESRPRLVRGFDYYTHTVFETTLPGLGSQDAVLGGGRYDHLVEDLGGSPTPAVGASLGVERLALALAARDEAKSFLPRVDLAICLLDEAGLEMAARLAAECRQAGLSVRFDYQARSPKAALRDANRVQALFAALIGAEEIASACVQLKDLASGEQRAVALAEVSEAVRAGSAR
jgi:histidyl-tRNA synthetase